MHTKLPKSVFFFKNSSFFVAWFSKNSRNGFLIRNFKANCLSRHDQKVYSIFKIVPLGVPHFYSSDFTMKGSVYPISNNDHQFFQDSYCSKIWKHFHPYFFIFFCTEIYSPFRSINKIHDDKRHLKQVYSFHANADIKVKFTFFKKCIRKWKYSWSKDKQKLPLVDLFILMLLMTTDQFSEIDRICVDQGLDLVLEGRAIFHGMPLTPSWYSHLALISYPFGYGGLLGLTGMTEIP